MLVAVCDFFMYKMFKDAANCQTGLGVGGCGFLKRICLANVQVCPHNVGKQIKNEGHCRSKLMR